MSDLIARLRKLRTKAESINSTLVDDLYPFYGHKEPVFRRLPVGSDEEGNVTTTCSCLMSLATSRKLIPAFIKIKDLESEAEPEARNRIMEVFEHVVNASWTSSGLPDLNAFSALIVLRAAGILSQCAETPLTKPALDMTHRSYDKEGNVIKGEPARNLKEIALKEFIEDVPNSFKVGKFPPTPAIGYWFVDAIDKLGLTAEVDDARWKLITLWASQEFARQFSLVTSEVAARMDPVALAAAACLCTRLRRLIAEKSVAVGKRDELMKLLPTKIEVNKAILQALESQQRSGIWPKYFPLFNYGKDDAAGSNYFFSFELLEAIVGEFEKSDLLENGLVLDGIERALDWCERNRLEYKIHDNTYRGWNSGGQIATLAEGKPESWATAVVHMFLWKLRETLCWLIRKHTLIKYGAVLQEVTKPDEDWKKFIDSPIKLPDEVTTVKKIIEEEILKQISKQGDDVQMDDEIAGRRSVLLFGPPGTAKTSLVSALSSKIKWPLIELNPSNFLGMGLEKIYKQVEDVFNDLNDVWGTVIFFDEMDALAHSRTDDTIDVTRQLLTTSMLPKLSRLHGDRRVLFFMATNHLRHFDSAIKRPGRFDLLICMAPPRWEEKIKNIRRFLKSDSSAAERESVAKRLEDLATNDETIELLNLFTFDDFKSFLEHIRNPDTTRSSFETMKQDEFSEIVKNWADNFIALNTRKSEPSPRKEFETNFAESRRQ